MADVSKLKKMYRTAVTEEHEATLLLTLTKEQELRYGENPNQPGALYALSSSPLAQLTNIQEVKSGKGGLSATNLMDVTRAMEILKYFSVPAVAVMKHTIPSGFACQQGEEHLAKIYTKARDADARAAFGSVVVFNRRVDEEIAKEILTSYVEAVAAPSFAEEAIALLTEKKSMRLLTFEHLEKIPKFAKDEVGRLYEVKSIPTGRLVVQKPYLTSIDSVEKLIIQPSITTKEGVTVTLERTPSEQEQKDILTSWYVNLGVRSNGIVIVKDGVTLAVGSGQQERVGAVEQAILKAYQKAMDRLGIEYDAMRVMDAVDQLEENPLQGAILSSDGFFPFRDSIDLIAQHGITAVIQPGGSVKDKEVIEAANEHSIAMVFTGERCFGHF